MKKIQFTSGCPNNCQYCYEPKEMTYYNPKIPQNTDVQILDMNFLANPKSLWYAKKLFESKGNAMTKSKLKDKWYKQYIEDLKLVASSKEKVRK